MFVVNKKYFISTFTRSGTHARTHTDTQTHSLSLTHTLFGCFCLSLSPTLSPSPTLHTHTLSLFAYVSLSITHIHTQFPPYPHIDTSFQIFLLRINCTNMPSSLLFFLSVRPSFFPFFLHKYQMSIFRCQDQFPERCSTGPAKPRLQLVGERMRRAGIELEAGSYQLPAAAP